MDVNIHLFAIFIPTKIEISFMYYNKWRPDPSFVSKGGQKKIKNNNNKSKPLEGMG
jgi:hypothetical protein